MTEIFEAAKALGLPAGTIAVLIAVYLFNKYKSTDTEKAIEKTVDKIIEKANGHLRVDATGFVSRDECHTHIDGLRREIGEVHEKVNRTSESVARIEGYLKK